MADSSIIFILQKEVLTLDILSSEKKNTRSINKSACFTKSNKNTKCRGFYIWSNHLSFHFIETFLSLTIPCLLIFLLSFSLPKYSSFFQDFQNMRSCDKPFLYSPGLSFNRCVVKTHSQSSSLLNLNHMILGIEFITLCYKNTIL